MIAEQLAEFEANLPKDYQVPIGDFAASLQWSSWQGHLEELRQELAEARAAEANTPDTGFSGIKHLLSNPVFQAGYMAGTESPCFINRTAPDWTVEITPEQLSDEDINIWRKGFETAVA